MKSFMAFSLVMFFLVYGGHSLQNNEIVGDFKIVCYFTNWSFYRRDSRKYTPENIDEKLCTHIVYAFAVLDPDTLSIQIKDQFTDINNKLYEKVTALRQKGINVLLAIGGGTDSKDVNKYTRLLTDRNARHNFTNSVTKFLEKHNFGGLDLDLEHFPCWQAKCDPDRANEKDDFVALASEVSAAFKQNGLLLSAAVSTVKIIIDIAYDITKLAQHLDWIGMMAYDFHGHWNGKTGHNAPFHSSPDNRDLEFITNYFMERGAPSTKLVLGLPTYGRSFTLADAANNGLNVPSTGPGQAGPFTRNPGVLSHYEICDEIWSNRWQVVRDTESRIGPYAFSGNQWVSYDDVEYFRAKANFVRGKSLGGVMIWSLDLDDFFGKCGDGNYPLLKALNKELRNKTLSPM